MTCRKRLALTVALLVRAAGCTRGPGNIDPDGFNDSAAITRSDNEQLLSNLVRLHYSQAPAIRNVGSVLRQDVWSGRVGADGRLVEGLGVRAQPVRGPVATVSTG